MDYIKVDQGRQALFTGTLRVANRVAVDRPSTKAARNPAQARNVGCDSLCLCQGVHV